MRALARAQMMWLHPITSRQLAQLREWGVEVADADLTSLLCDRIDDVAARPDVYAADLAAAESSLWDTTVRNLSRIRSAVTASASPTEVSP